jgi:outer membrane protein assembly factor BamA
VPQSQSGATRPSDINGGVSYTQKKQFSLGIHYDLYSPHDNYYAKGAFDYKRIPFEFLGVGDQNGPDPIDHYTPLWRGGMLEVTRNLERTQTGEGLNAGLEAVVRDDQILSSDSGAPLQSGTVPGSSGGLSSGIGVAGNYDTRDNVYSTHSGEYIAFDALFYTKATGSDFHYSQWDLDARKFITVTDNQILALQALLTLAAGNVPFYTMSQLGGEYNMRGYYQGRFRDRNMAVVQAEYRLPVWWRFGLVVFGDAGEVAHTFGAFALNGLHYTYGGGVRFLVITRQRIGVRLDYGLASDSHELYLSINEAF